MIKDLIAWYKEDKYQIRWTVAGAVLSTALALICENLSFFNGDLKDFRFELPLYMEYGIQSLFIIISIFSIFSEGIFWR